MAKRDELDIGQQGVGEESFGAGRKMAGRAGANPDRGTTERARNLGTARDDVADRVRAHPFVSVGAAMGAGFLIGRVLGGEDEKSSTARRPLGAQERGWAGRARNIVGGGATGMLARRVRDRVNRRR